MNAIMRQKVLNQYQQTSVETNMENATPYKLISMLYDGAVDNLFLVKGAIQRKDFELKSQKMNKVILIIDTLSANLDMKEGGEVADNLESLYEYINRKLLEASAANDLHILDEVIDLIKELRDGWTLIPNDFKKASKNQLNSIKKF